jgi:hypothetical protein
VSGQLCRGVLLQQVPRVVDPVQLRVWDPLVQPRAVLRRQNPVMASPQQPHRDRDVGERGLVRAGIGFGELAVLPVVGRLALCAAPWGEEGLEDVRAQAQMTCMPQVGRDDGLVSVAG